MYRTSVLSHSFVQGLTKIPAGRLLCTLGCFLSLGVPNSNQGVSAPPQRDMKKAAPVDRYGDPLPQGALVRLGTLRFRHPSGIRSMVFSPDGNVLATCGVGSVSLWNCKSGKELPRLPAQHVNAIAFSPDGKTLVTASDREKIRLWDIQKGKEIRAFAVRRKRSWIDRAALAFAVLTSRPVIGPMSEPPSRSSRIAFSVYRYLLAAT